MSTVESELNVEDEHESGGAVTPVPRRAPRISQSDVFAAADMLLVEGHRPTIDRVRMKLGRGSPNTINDHLDAWWAKLGARLRDLPGQEFPALPERVAQSLQQLWNAALEGAHESLQGTLLKREQALQQREQELEVRTRQLAEREHAMAASAAALEQSLTLAREQLAAANRRAETLEAALQERDTEGHRLRTQIEALAATGADLRSRFDGAAAAYQAERAKLQEQYAASETRWLGEVDRSRQAAKEVAKESERQLKELRGRNESLESDRDRLRGELMEARSELKTAIALREQHERLRRPGHSSARSARSAATTRRPKPRAARDGDADRPIRAGRTRRRKGA